MKFGSVCSGIEAASVAWHPLGMKAAWFAEIEPFPCAVLAHRFPSVPNLGDMTAIAANLLRGEVEAPDILVGGTPCQAFSVAGMREGLSDERGALTLKFVEIANAIDHVRARSGQPAAVITWENVPGVLSSRDNAFGCFLGALAGAGCELQPAGKRWTNSGCVYGPQRAVAWRILDAQYFGLAQRRRRVFVIASARAGFDPAAVLFESDSVRRDIAPRRGEGKDIAGRAPFGPALQCGCSYIFGESLGAWGCPSCEGEDGPAVSILAGAPAFGGESPESLFKAGTLTAHAGRQDFASENFVMQPVAGTLQAAGKAAGSATQQDAESGLLLPVYAIQAGALRTNSNSGPDGIGVQADHAYTLEARAEVQAVCVTGSVTHTLKADGFDGSEDGTGRGQPIIAFHGSQDPCVSGDVTHPLGRNHGQEACLAHFNQQGMRVRRITPIEGERLQGFPDNHTLIPWRGKPAEECPDGPRYKAIGNSMATYVMRWLGKRIQSHMQSLDISRAAA